MLSTQLRQKNNIDDGVAVVSDNNSGGFPYEPSSATEQSAITGSDLLNATAIEELISYMNEEERSSFFEDFIADGSTYISTLIDCNDISKVEEARDAMHAFAGACLVIGAEKLAKNARDLEMSDTQLLVREHTDLHDDILATFAQTTEGIRALY